MTPLVMQIDVKSSDRYSFGLQVATSPEPRTADWIPGHIQEVTRTEIADVLDDIASDLAFF